MIRKGAWSRVQLSFGSSPFDIDCGAKRGGLRSSPVPRNQRERDDSGKNSMISRTGIHTDGNACCEVVSMANGHAIKSPLWVEDALGRSRFG